MCDLEFSLKGNSIDSEYYNIILHEMQRKKTLQYVKIIVEKVHGNKSRKDNRKNINKENEEYGRKLYKISICF